MTLRPLPRSRLDGLIPSLVQGHALVALVAGTGDDRWAADAAWAVARAALTGGRRVALVDLWMAEPQLSHRAGISPDAPGIVDVFERNAELTTAAQDVGGVFFIPTGSRSEAPEFVLAHPRWKKLHAGFKAEGALLLVYLSAGSLASLSVIPDAVIVLAPAGFDLTSPLARDVQAAQVDGAMLLGVVRDRWTPPPMPVPLEERIPGELPPEPPRPSARRWIALGAGAVVVLGAATGAWLVWRGLGAAAPAAPAAADQADAREPAAAPAAPPEPAPDEPVTPTGPADTLAYAVQLAAYANVVNALAHADELAAAGTPALVAPVTPGGSRVVWYRVFVGGWPDRAAAAAGRDSLWMLGLARRGEGEVVRAPLILALGGSEDAAALRRRGIPAMAVGRGLVVGAFESAEQAAPALQQLSRAGIPADLVPRLERTP
jgi:hypothetical protein